MNLKYSFIKDMSELKDVLEKCPGFQFAENIDQLIELACGSAENNYFEVKYEFTHFFCFHLKMQICEQQ